MGGDVTATWPQVQALLAEVDRRIEEQAQEKVRAITDWIELNELCMRLANMLQVFHLVEVKDRTVHPGVKGLPGQTKVVRIVDEVTAPAWRWRQRDARRELGWFDTADTCGFVSRLDPPPLKPKPSDLPVPDVTA